METRRPILVTGSHRSGTGWVAAMLTASTSPPVAYLWEPFNRLHRPGICDVRFPYWFPYVCGENGSDLVEPIADMLAFRYRGWAELRVVRTPKDVARMVRDWMRFRDHARRDAVAMQKDPLAVFSAEWLHETFDMDVVVLIRHPAGFAYSLKRRGWTHPFDHFLKQPLLLRDLLGPFEPEIRRYATDPPPIIDQAILLWNLIHSAVGRYRDLHPDWRFLRLEDMAAEPVAAFRGLFASLGLAFDGSVRDTIVRSSDPSNPTEDLDPSAIRRNSRASILAWKRGLAAEEIDRVRAGVEHVSKDFYSDPDW
jgi:hypothetical protein